MNRNFPDRLLGARHGSQREDDKELEAAFRERLDLVPALLLKLADQMTAEARAESPEFVIFELTNLVPWIVWQSTISDQMLDAIDQAESPEEKRILYAVALRFMGSGLQKDSSTFERAWHLAATKSLVAIRDKMCGQCVWGGYQKKHACQQWYERRKAARRRAKIASDLRSRLPNIRTGTDIGALHYLVQIRFAMFADKRVERALPARERLQRAVEPEVLAAAEAGFQAFLSSVVPPQPEEIARWFMTNSISYDAFLLLAGADLMFEKDRENFLKLDAERLASIACIAIVLETHTEIDGLVSDDKREWISEIYKRYPEQTAEFVCRFIRVQLETDAPRVAGIDEICRDSALEQLRKKLSSRIFERICPRPHNGFWALVRVLCSDEDQKTLLARVQSRLAECIDLAPMQRWAFLHIAWRLSAAEYDAQIRKFVSDEPELIWDLIEGTGDLPIPLTIAHRSVLVELAGAIFPPASPPRTGWGSRHEYNGSEFVHRQLNELASSPDRTAQGELYRLLDIDALSLYRPYILHAIATSQKGLRQRTYIVSSISRIVAALQGGAPTSAADRMAFVAEHLAGLNAELRTTQFQMWLQFWNTDSHGRPDQPKVENVCRDQLSILLRSRFGNAGLDQDTEVRYAGDNRCDISIRGIDGALPIEVKRDTHPMLWTAWADQLHAKYTLDPNSQGYGLYVVFWFGSKRKAKMPSRPDKRPDPISATECQDALNAMISSAGCDRLQAIVLDVSPV